MLGQFIAKGQYREVYYLEYDNNYVVKKEIRRSKSYNLKEYRTFLYLVKKDWAHWVAPCFLLGEFIIMPYCKKPKKWPKEIPCFLRDAHKKNFGIYQNKFVCIDYPMVNKIDQVSMIKPKWVV